MAEDEVSTDDAVMNNFGLNHYEGGWSREIDVDSEELKATYPKCAEQSKLYRSQLKAACMKMKHKIAQNNTANIFEEYFTDSNEYGRSFDPQIESIAFYDLPMKNNKWNVIANHSSIASSSHDKMIVCYMPISMGQMNTSKNGASSYIWDLNNNLQPLLELKCKSSLATAEYNEKDEFVIAAGQTDGNISLFDVRVGGDAVQNSICEWAHREPVTSLRWTMSKGNVEFFTCANDAFVMWWDSRYMTKPHESFQQELNGAGCSALDYTFSMPTRFLVGTTNGLIVNGNKRGLTYSDRFSYTVESFSGPVHSIERNPFADKYSMCVGDQSVRFWSDENRESPIMQTIEYSNDLSCGAWNRNRVSNFFIGHSSGAADVWDLLYDQYKPIASIANVNSRVQHIRSHPNGKLLISSHANGDVYLMQISPFLASHKIVEKAKLIEIFDRELSREVLLLTKIREQKMQNVQCKDDSTDGGKIPSDETILSNCINEFDLTIKKESE